MIPAPPSRTATAVGGTVVSASVQEVRWRAETTTVGSGTASSGTNGAHTNGTHNGKRHPHQRDRRSCGARGVRSRRRHIGGEPDAARPTGEIDIEVVAPPKKKRWFRRTK